MRLIRIMLAILVLTLMCLACAAIVGLIPQAQMTEIALKVIALVGVLTVGGLVVKFLVK